MNTDYLTLTKQYYAAWLGVAPSFLDRKGVFPVFNSERDERQRGHSARIDLYCFVSQGTAIISYGQRLQKDIGRVESCFRQEKALEDTKASLSECLGVRPGHSYKYYFRELRQGLNTTLARQLTRNDYGDFLHFHRSLYPDGDQESWLEEYFNAIADKGYVHGVYVDERLVSATDAPDMPYMADVIVEIGVNTLPEFRRRGHAKAVVGASLKHLVNTEKVPIWSCGAANTASQELAESVGYVKFADVIGVTLQS